MLADKYHQIIFFMSCHKLYFLQVERKRARNRVAASKCRLRKLERISVLDAQAQTLKSDNERLAALADKLRYINLAYRVTHKVGLK